MRKATGEYWNSELKKYIPTTGDFHQWAARYNEFETGPGNYTVALIEDFEGNIRECEPNTVKFLS